MRVQDVGLTARGLDEGAERPGEVGIVRQPRVVSRRAAAAAWLNGCASSVLRGSAKRREDAHSRKTPKVAAIAQEVRREKQKEDERKIVPESFPEN